MTRQDTDLTDMLRHVTNAGASGAFVAALATDMPGDDRHHARNRVRRATRGDRALPGPWGGFLTALWRGDVATAWRRADGRNKRLMRTAGLAPTEELTAAEANPAVGG